MSCSVICDDNNRTLASFHKDVLDKQVDDIIHFPYKFTGLVNDKHIVAGVKQEAVIKVRCFIDTEASEKAIYLIQEELKCEIKTSEKLESASSQHRETVRMENSVTKLTQAKCHQNKENCPTNHSPYSFVLDRLSSHKLSSLVLPPERGKSRFRQRVR